LDTCRANFSLADSSEREKNMHGLVILGTQSDLQDVGGLALVINEMFRNVGISGTARAYFDDIDDGVEYGVRIDVEGLSETVFRALLDSVAQHATETYRVDVRVEA